MYALRMADYAMMFYCVVYKHSTRARCLLLLLLLVVSVMTWLIT